MQTNSYGHLYSKHVHHVSGHSDLKKKKKCKDFPRGFSRVKEINTKENNNPVKVKQNEDFLPVHETLTLDP